MHRHLNSSGVKDSAGMWRTFNGVRYPHWSTEQYDGQALEMWRAGVRCRRRGCEIFVHPDDDAKAARFAR
jgi:hypothetical protein